MALSYSEAEKRLKELCSVILKDARTAAPMAIGYAENVFRTTIQTKYYLEVQISYILANLESWRGDLARETKRQLRELRAELQGETR
jgi:hypothetical protein